MTQEIEHPEVQDFHESDTLVHDVQAPDHEPLTVPEEWTRDHGTAAQERRRPVRWMRWLGAAVVLVVATGVALFVRNGGDDPVTPATDVVSIENDWDHLLNPAPEAAVVSIENDWDHLLLNPPVPETAIVSIDNEWDHLLQNPAPETAVVSTENEWDHLLLNPPVAETAIVSTENEWDHLLLAPTTATDVVSIENDWDHLLLNPDR